VAKLCYKLLMKTYTCTYIFLSSILHNSVNALCFVSTHASLDDASLNDASLDDASLDDASLDDASLDDASLDDAVLG
jgi:uncharacterized protein YjbI with pentapeptide repeats